MYCYSLKVFAITGLSLCVLGCSTPKQAPPREDANRAALSEHGVHHYVSKLAKQLFGSNDAMNIKTLGVNKAQAETNLNHKRIAIGTFLPVERLEKDLNDVSELQLGLQVQESLQSLLVQLGFQVVEFKLTNDIYLRNDQDKVLSRSLQDLESAHQVEYYVSGTLLRQEDAYVVNAKVINVKSKQVLAAATEYIPDNALWSSTKVKMKRDKLYRVAY